MYFDGVIWFPHARPRPECVWERKKRSYEFNSEHCYFWCVWNNL